jgi:hypothetical protein
LRLLSLRYILIDIFQMFCFFFLPSFDIYPTVF